MQPFNGSLELCHVFEKVINLALSCGQSARYSAYFVPALDKSSFKYMTYGISSIDKSR